MTFSILARDPDTQIIGGAAATGSLCVGGWVLRGGARHGLSASQGRAPSTLWGEDVIDLMAQGHSPQEAVETVTGRDAGRGYRQLSALNCDGAGAAFTGQDNTPVTAERVFANGVAAGNMLTSKRVIDHLIEQFQTSAGTMAERLMDALDAAHAAGGDSRGLLSAALLVLSPDHAPISLRIDHSETPLADLRRLLTLATSGDYAYWSANVPTLSDPERIVD